jgi:hypothetical protein
MAERRPGKRVAAKVAADAGGRRPPLDDSERRAGRQGVAGEIPPLVAGDRLEERGLRERPDAGRLEALSGYRGAAIALRYHQAGAALSNPAARLADW